MSFSYENCTLCARNCGKDRTKSIGYCKMSDKLYVSRASLHQWEEPIISGERGSGTIFFSGCSLRCVFCQNREISRGISGVEISEERLAEIMLERQYEGAHNVNLVTPTHYAPSIKNAVIIAREKGLSIPIVYNTSGYDSREALSMMEDVVDAYLVDFKFYLPKTAKLLSDAENYVDTVKTAIEEMVRQKGKATLDKDGMIKKGVVVRILLLPAHLAEAKLTVSYLYKKYKDDIYISLMSQFTPSDDFDPPLNRRVTSSEYSELVEYAASLGIKNAFIQEKSSASESFIPPFDHSGVLKVE